MLKEDHKARPTPEGLLQQTNDGASVPASGSLASGLRDGIFSLSELKSGAEAIVIDVLYSDYQARLLEMGFVPGSQCEVIQAGDPALISLQGAKLALRKSLLDLVQVIECERPITQADHAS